MHRHHSEMYQPVGLLKRWAAIFYDGLLLLAVLFFASLIVMLPFEITYEHPFYPAFVIYIYAISFLFLGWSWTRTGQTLGMKTWRIYVQQNNGQLINWKQAFIRYSCALLFWLPAALYSIFISNEFEYLAFLSLTPIGLDYLWCLIDPKKRALHDIISGTRIVMKPVNIQ